MALLYLALLFAWLIVVAGVRGYLDYRRTGQVAMRVADRRGSPQWWARLSSSLGLAVAIVAPIADIAGLPSFGPLDDPSIAGLGVGLVVVGTVVTVISQRAMGASWRGDVDPAVRTDLVTSGPYRYVRNPILLGTAISMIGFALIVPNVLSLAMLVAFASALEIQVRLVEEPYLLRIHGDAYRQYAARTGRFIPGLGRRIG